MIASETFYRAECDHDGCKASLPDEDHEASHWPMESVKEALANKDEMYDGPPWAVVGEQTFCPRHRPGNTECSACDGRGYFRAELPEPIEGRRWDFTQCPVCSGEGYMLASEPDDSATPEAG